MPRFFDGTGNRCRWLVVHLVVKVGWRVVRLGGFVALLFAAQTWFLSRKVAWVTPEDYATYAYDLHQGRTWRFGYAPGHHGAHLVRSAPDARPAQREGLGGSGEYALAVRSEMEHELFASPARASLEFAFYLLVSVLVVGVSTMASVRRVGRYRWSLILVTAALLLSLPLLSIGYGCSMYSNYVGPGAFSSSSGYLRVTLIPAETVSYRSVAEAVGLAPLLLLRPVLSGAWLDVVPFRLFWCVLVVAFYGVAGFAVGFVSERYRRRR